MSGLSALKFIKSEKQVGSSPKQSRRNKLSSKIYEQIQLAQAMQSGTDFSPIKTKFVTDAETGESRKLQVPKKLKPWWWTAESGKTCITVRYGARTLEVVEGKNAIETENLSEVVTTLQILKSAVEAGELDSRIEALSGLVKVGFDGNKLPQKRATLTLPKKSI